MPEPVDPARPVVTPEDLKSVAQSINKHTAAGPSGSPMFVFVTPLRIANPTEHDDAFASNLAWLANQMHAGALWTRAFCRDVRLVGIKEANGRNRPIQIAEALDRFLAKVLLGKHRATFLSRFGDLQQGMAPSGMEKTVFLVDSLLECSKSSVLLTTDLANAFNEVSRDFIEAELKRHVPGALAYFRLRYGVATQVRFGEFFIECAEGVRQGCPWSGALFCLALMPLLEAIDEKFGDCCFVRAAFDDINVVVFDPEDLSVADLLTEMTTEAAKLGMQVRLGKCALYSKNHDAKLALSPDDVAAISELPRRDTEVSSLKCIPRQNGVVLLGTPIGHADYVARQCVRLVEEVARDMRHLALLEDHPQEYFLLLRHCYNAKPQYLAWTVRPDALLRAAKQFDHAVNGRIAAPLAGLQRASSVRTFKEFAAPFQQARLPFELGGLHIPSLQQLSYPAYASALATCWNALPSLDAKQVYADPLRRCLHSIVSKVTAVVVDDAEFPSATTAQHAEDRARHLRNLFPQALPDNAAAFLQTLGSSFDALWAKLVERAGSKGVQHRLSSVVASHAYDVLLKRLFPAQQGPVATRRSGRVAKFLSSSCRQAVEFTRVVPSSPDLTVPREAYLMAMAFHLHLPVPGRPLIGDSCIGHRHRMDALGHHLLQCWQHRTVPHDGLCRKLHGLCRSAGLAARLEPTNCLTHQDAGSERRPDIAVEGLASGGRVLLLDATTADPSAVTTLNTFKSHRIEGAAAAAGERRKRAEYQGHFHRGQFDFKPLAIELTGRWGTDLTSFFNAVCSKARTLHGLNATRYGYFVSYWRSRISVSFTRSLAEQAVHTKLQIYRGSQANNPLEPVELARAF